MRSIALASSVLAAPLLAGCHGHGHAPGECSVPGSTIGIAAGDQVPVLHWQGYEASATTLSTVLSEDFHDCDGKKGINAVLVDTSAVWCGPCQTAASRIHDELQGSWANMGIRVLTLVAQDGFGDPATPETALSWRSRFQLDDTAVGADPAFSFAPATEQTIGLPIEVVVDPRTMQIVDRQEGYTGDYSTLTDLASQNAP